MSQDYYWGVGKLKQMRLAWVVGAMFATTTPAFASLGEARLLTALGQPLRATIPTIGLAADEIDPRCVRIFRPQQNDGLPLPNDLYLEFREFGSSKIVTVRTRNAVQEPAIRFGVEVMCGQSVRREYVLLLDPAPVADVGFTPTPPVLESAMVGEPPVVVGRAQRRSAALGASRSIAGEGISTVDAPRKPRPKALKKATPSVAQGSVELPAAKNSTRDNAPRLSIRGSDSLTRAVDLTALASPRLRSSFDLAAAGLSVPPKSDVERAVMNAARQRLLATPIDSDMRPQLEVDLMIAQKRIQELQARLAAADPRASAATNAAVSAALESVPQVAPIAPTAQEPQKPMAPKTVSREQQPVGGSMVGNIMPWVWLPALLALVAGGLAWVWLGRKRRQEEQERAYAAAAAAVGLSPDVNNDQAGGGFVDTRMRSLSLGTRPQGKTVPGRPVVSTDGDTIRNVVASMSGSDGMSRSSDIEGVTTIKVHGRETNKGTLDLSSDLFQPQFETDKLDVSMVSAVTEEASVYVELNRMPEAIAVLKDHIDLERAYARATPAPWLMLLDLYHREDNRVEFEKLRTDFMKNFNGRIPEWGAYIEAGADKMLIEHDHIIERLIRYWATPKCHQYVQKLLYDHRDNSRIGFSLTAYRELVLLDTIHMMAYPLDDSEKQLDIPDMA